MYLKESESQLERSQFAAVMQPVPSLADVGYANSLGVEYFCLMADRNRQVQDSSEAPAVKKD